MRPVWSRESLRRASPSSNKSPPVTPRWTRPSRKPGSGSPKAETCKSSDFTKAASSPLREEHGGDSHPSGRTSRRPWNRHWKKPTFSANLPTVEGKKPSRRNSFCRCRDLIFQPPTSPVSSCAAATFAKPESGSRTRARRRKSPPKRGAGSSPGHLAAIRGSIQSHALTMKPKVYSISALISASSASPR